MSKEILEATTALAREKGIAPDKLFFALEDALLSAYKKTARRRQVRPRRDGPRDRRLQRLRAPHPRAARGPAASSRRSTRAR